MLRRDPSCMRDMLWRIEVDADITALAERLGERGWRDRSRLPLLLDLEGPAGHALVMVPRTGRVQLRLHYLTRAEDRPAAAAAVYERVIAAAAAVERLS